MLLGTAGPALVLLLPAGLVQRILDDFYRVAAGRARQGLTEGPHQRQACFLHHAPGGDIRGHRFGGHALYAGLGEAFADQRARPFGSVPLAPA